MILEHILNITSGLLQKQMMIFNDDRLMISVQYWNYFHLCSAIIAMGSKDIYELNVIYIYFGKFAILC